MTASDIVDAKYRIHAADLQGQEREWVVANVSYQGLEDMSPVLHIEGSAKRLVLDSEQSRQMMQLTRTAMPDEWIGARIRVSPVQKPGSETIAIRSVDLPRDRRSYLIGALLAKWKRLVLGSILLFAVFALTSFGTRAGRSC